MSFTVHTMEYRGGAISEELHLRNYEPSDYEEYRRIYEESFFRMRSSLGLKRECCKSFEELLQNKDNIFIMEENGNIRGSVAVYGNEIDDLFVAGEYRKKGYGLKLLEYAVSYLRKSGCDKIILHVADVNKEALSLYLANGFIITSTEEIT